MDNAKPFKACGAVYFGFEVVRCQLAAGHIGWHEVAGLRWRPWLFGNPFDVPPSDAYQAQVRKRAVKK